MKNRSIILASGSPRRQQFLRELGVEFQVIVADVDETPHPGEAPEALAYRLAEAKANAVSQRLPVAQEALIIAADTVVAQGTMLLGKPADPHEATTMLQQLRNRPHYVHSSVCVLDKRSDQSMTHVNSTEVYMRNYSDAELATYVAGGDPLDKAGAYAIQHPEFAPVCALNGCISGVIGLPLGDLERMLASFGVTITSSIPSICAQHTHFGCCQTTVDSCQ